jgi:hypothetical protein
VKIALLPLDERPVNTRYPRMIAAIAGVEVILPPENALPEQRKPASIEYLLTWLLIEQQKADKFDTYILSLDMLIYGGLIASRLHGGDSNHDRIHTSHILSSIEMARASNPQAKIYGFNVITRIPDADNAIEEPEYWELYGRRIHRYSALMHRAGLGHDVAEELEQLRAEISPEHLHDFTLRRLRNHQVNLRVLELAANNAFDLLVISSDDTSEYGMGSEEKAWLQTWARRLELDASRLLMYPGADEVGCVLVMRAANEGQPTPTFYVHYAIDADKERIAPFEDSPVRMTVERQIRALGGIEVDTPATADFIVAVNPPSIIYEDYDAEHPLFAEEQIQRAPFMQDFVRQIAQWLAENKRVIVCDVAYSNGSDPALINPMLATIDLRQLAAYGAWNTAGNTIGTALAHGLASAKAITPEQKEAQQRFLLHRFVEDWGYQHIVRQHVRNELIKETGSSEITEANEATVIERIQRELQKLMPQLGALSARWHITQVRLPWHRLFEVDFELERGDDAHL